MANRAVGHPGEEAAFRFPDVSGSVDVTTAEVPSGPVTSR
jgi:hypothetical protein